MAQSRRRRENDTFTDMAEVLPIQENAKDLDKASIFNTRGYQLSEAAGSCRRERSFGVRRRSGRRGDGNWRRLNKYGKDGRYGKRISTRTTMRELERSREIP